MSQTKAEWCLITYLSSGLGPYANQDPSPKRMLHSVGLREGPAGAHWVMTLEYSGAPNPLETQIVKGRSFKDTAEADS